MRSQASPWYNTQYAPSQYEGDINSFIGYGDKVNEHWERPRAVVPSPWSVDAKAKGNRQWLGQRRAGVSGSRRWCGRGNR